MGVNHLDSYNTTRYTTAGISTLGFVVIASLSALVPGVFRQLKVIRRDCYGDSPRPRARPGQTDAGAGQGCGGGRREWGRRGEGAGGTGSAGSPPAGFGNKTVLKHPPWAGGTTVVRLRANRCLRTGKVSGLPVGQVSGLSVGQVSGLPEGQVSGLPVGQVSGLSVGQVSGLSVQTTVHGLCVCRKARGERWK